MLDQVTSLATAKAALSAAQLATLDRKCRKLTGSHTTHDRDATYDHQKNCIQRDKS